MAEPTRRFHEEIETLRTIRDELRVKLNLATKEARDLFEAAEKSWGTLEARLRLIERESRKELEGIGESARELAREIHDAYKRVRELL